MWTQHVIQQTGQLTHGALRVGVSRTLADDDGPYAVLRLSVSGAEHAQELTLRPGDVTALEGIGDLLLLAAEPSTRERRGSVRLALEGPDVGGFDGAGFDRTGFDRTGFDSSRIDEGAAHG